MIDSRAKGGNPICGGYNYEVKGGELWPRAGYAGAVPLLQPDKYVAYAGSTAQKIISYYRNGSGFTYIIYPDVVFKLSSPSGALTVPYTTYAAAVNLSWTFGSTAVTAAATNWTNGDIVRDPSDSSAYFRIVSGGGTLNGVLDRAYYGATGVFVGERWNGLRAITNTTTDACVFQQGVTHAAGAVWATAPATTAGREYLILCYSGSQPVAIDLSTTSLPLTDWWRDSSLGPAAALGKPPSTCCVHKSNLILGGAGDPSDNYDNFCIWYSQPRDLLQWHTGVAGVDATPNSIRFVEGKDEIRAVRTIGDRLVVHRQLSQEVGEYTGSIDFPYRFTRNDQQLGVNSHRQIAEIERRHFMFTHRGPAMYDGNDVRLFGDEVQDIFERDGDAGNTGIADVHVFALQSIGKVIYTGLTTMIDPDSERLGYTSTFAGRMLTYDVKTGQWAVHCYPDRPQTMASLLTRTSEANDDEYSRDLWVGTDGDIYETSTNAYWYGFDHYKASYTREFYVLESGVANNLDEKVIPVPATVTTRWYDFDSASQKLLTNIEIELRDSFVRQCLRRLYLAGVSGSVTGKTFVLNLRIYRDYDLDTPYFDKDIPIPASDFGATTGTGRGWGAEKLLKIEWPLKVQGDVFAFEFGNVTTRESLLAGYHEGEWRIVDALVTYVDTGSMRRVNTGPG